MWESNNLDSPAGQEPGGPEPDRAPAGSPPEVAATGHAEVVGTPQASVRWAGPVLQGVSTPRVFSALASAAGTPSPNGGNGSSSVHHEPEQVHDDEDEDAEEYEEYEEDELAVDGQVWSAEAAAARMRAQRRWRELNPGPMLPSLTLTEEEAAALLPPEEQPAPVARVAAAPVVSTRVAPWLPTSAPSVVTPVTAFGPVGRRRSPAMVVLLSVVTLGFYALWWHHRVNREMGEFDPRMSVDPGGSTWAVAYPLIFGWLVAAAAGARYLLALGGTPTADLPISAEQSLLLAFSPLVVPYLVLFLPFSAAAVLMTHERARIVEDRVDTPVDRQLRPTAALAWLAVPVVGGLVGMARLQQHLNEVWAAVVTS